MLAALLQLLFPQAAVSQEVKEVRHMEVVVFSSLSFLPADKNYFSKLIIDDIPKSDVHQFYNTGMYSYYLGRLFLNAEIGFTYSTSNSDASGLESILRRQYLTTRVGYNFIVKSSLIASAYSGAMALRMKHKTDTPDGFGLWPDYSSDPLHRARLTQFSAPIGVKVTIPLFNRMAVLQAYGEYLIPLGNEPVLNTKNLAVNIPSDPLLDGYAVGIGVGYNFGIDWMSPK